MITLPDLRWGRCDIKSINLLPNVLARQSAAAAGCREAWLIDRDGNVTEGSASNAYIVDGAGRLITHPLGERILGGITRSVVLELARDEGIEVVEQPFSLDEAHAGAGGGAVQHQLLAAAGHVDRWSSDQQWHAGSRGAAPHGPLRRASGDGLNRRDSGACGKPG